MFKFLLKYVLVFCCTFRFVCVCVFYVLFLFCLEAFLDTVFGVVLGALGL